MAGKAQAIRTSAQRPEDLHACLGEAISNGAKAGILIMVYPEGKGPPEGGDWEAWSTDRLIGCERAFIYQQLSLGEIANQYDGDD